MEEELFQQCLRQENGTEEDNEDEFQKDAMLLNFRMRSLIYIHIYKEFIRINNVTRLAVTLRWLAGGSYSEICFALEFLLVLFLKLWDTIAALNYVLEIGFPLYDEANLVEKFLKDFLNRMKGCVMAIFVEPDYLLVDQQIDIFVVRRIKCNKCVLEIGSLF